MPRAGFLSAQQVPTHSCSSCPSPSPSPSDLWSVRGPTCSARLRPVPLCRLCGGSRAGCLSPPRPLAPQDLCTACPTAWALGGSGGSTASLSGDVFLTLHLVRGSKTLLRAEHPLCRPQGPGLL